MAQGDTFSSIKCSFKWRGLEDREGPGLLLVGITRDTESGIVEIEGNCMNLTSRGSWKRNRGGAESRYTVSILEGNRKTRRM